MTELSKPIQNAEFECLTSTNSQATPHMIIFLEG